MVLLDPVWWREENYHAFCVLGGTTMQTSRLLALSLATLGGLSFLGFADLHPQSVSPSPLPAAPLRPVTDNYFGAKVVDSYRYMENLKDPEVEAWFKNQNNYARAMLARVPG